LSSEDVADAHGAATGTFLEKLQMDAWRCIFGNPQKTVEEERMDEYAAIIRTYRPTDMDAEDRHEAGPFVDGLCFNLTMAFFMFANTVVICLETDLTPIEDHAWYWLVVEGFFVLVYVTELGLRMFFHGWKWMFKDIWNFIVVLIVVCMVTDLVVYLATDMTVRLNLKAVSLVRILGLVYLRHSLQRSHWLEELKAVFNGIAVGSKAIVSILLLLLGIVYISAIFVTKQIGHNTDVYSNYRKLSGGWDHDEYFGTMGRSMYTLLQVMTLDGWCSRIGRHVVNQQTWMIAFFVVFLLVTNYGIVNIVVAVITQHICEVAEKNQERAKARQLRTQKTEVASMIEIFGLANKDNQGYIALAEFEAALTNPEVQARMRQLELPVEKENALKLFHILDGMGTRALKSEEFIAGCSKLKGPAQSKDMLGIQAQADTLSRRMDALCDSVLESERVIKRLDEVTVRLYDRYKPSVEGARRRIAHSVGGSKPMVQPKKGQRGERESEASLATGNRPQLPLFPDLY